MNTRNAPLSPVSVGGSEWSGITKYQNPDAGYNSNSRGLASPPDSGGVLGAMNGFPGPGPGGPRSVGGPSPPPSIARSSGGMYARSESGRSMRDENNEVVLGGHYIALKKYLQSTSKDGRANPAPNRARDKLLRLSPVQFLELSTDVYDELLRRQALGRRAPGPPPPPFLQPEDTFHPKRNQARQKLSTLGPPRFRDLATDVFCELERRFPNFPTGDVPGATSPISSRGPPSRAGTPSGSMIGMPGMPPRGMRRPSDASSIRSGAPRLSDYPAPPSPGMGPNGLQQKQFQSNTIVPNKSTMVEEDDDGLDSEDNAGFGMESAVNRASKRSDGTGISGVMSETDKRLLEESQAQVRDLQAKLDGLEDQLKRKDDELNRFIDEERSKSSTEDIERQEWEETRSNMEKRINEAQAMNDDLRGEIDRLRAMQDAEVNKLRADLDDALQQQSRGMGAQDGAGDAELQRENQELRAALQEQEHVTEDVRREAQQFLQEMKELSEQHNPAWEKQAELEKRVETLESEVREWRNRYARTKTQLRSLRASSMGLTIEDASKYMQEKGFTHEKGMIKDVHVTRFQISIDELLMKARTEEPEKAMESMKAVVVSVRRITRDMDEMAANDDDLVRQQQKLKSRVSATANNLITASKNFAASAGMSPVSLLDAAASHLVAAVVELLRTVKIRSTPAGELEDDDDGSITPVDTTAFFSQQTVQQDAYAPGPPQDVISPLVPPPRFNGLGGARDSTQSSAYSPVSSPRESNSQFNNQMRNGPSGLNGMTDANFNKPANGLPVQRSDDLKIYLEDQTAILVQTIQGLVGAVRGDANIQQINEEIYAIVDVVDRILSETERTGSRDESIDRLIACRERLLEAGGSGQDLASRGLGTDDREWRMWTQTLPPIAFEVARETKELVQRIDRLVMSPAADDFS